VLNGGRRGYLVGIAPEVCVRLLGAQPVRCALEDDRERGAPQGVKSISVASTLPVPPLGSVPLTRMFAPSTRLTAYGAVLLLRAAAVVEGHARTTKVCAVLFTRRGRAAHVDLDFLGFVLDFDLARDEHAVAERILRSRRAGRPASRAAGKPEMLIVMPLTDSTVPFWTSTPSTSPRCGPRRPGAGRSG
jgi:hypothetical protein